VSERPPALARVRPAFTIRDRGDRAPLVDLRATASVLGTITRYVSLTLLVPAGVALAYDEPVAPFVIPLVGAFVAGLAVERLTGKTADVGTREAFLVVSVTWLLVAALGCLPYLITSNPQLHHPVDAYFESMSGFTTTGASTLTDIEAMPQSILFWRGLTQWLGGMGIVVLALAVLPRLRVGGQQLFEHEAPGPELEKLTPSVRETARRLWLVYVFFSALQVLLLVLVSQGALGGGMNLFDAVTHMFGTMSTGGFSPETESLGAFGASAQWVVALFMVLAGCNFALLYRALRGRPIVLALDEELRAYLAIVGAATAIVAVALFATESYGVEETIRHAAFQVASIITTTGFASVDFAPWASLALFTLILLMFIGGCSGSTAGSIKVMRIVVLSRLLRREVTLTVHPQAVIPLRLNGRVVDERTLRAIVAFVVIYVGVFALGSLGILLEGVRTNVELSPFEAISAAATTLGNIGPGVGFLGPYGSFDPFSYPSKVLMTALMWLGRLEIIPVLVVLSRTYWRP
jgi:trk system potassium uptake protein